MALADEILAAVPSVVKRRTWFDDLPDDAQAELLQVRQRWQAGGYGPLLKRRTLGAMLVDRCRDRGWHTCDARRLAEWLAEKG